MSGVAAVAKSPVFVDYTDLVGGLENGSVDLNAKIEAAFSHDGLGLIVVRNVPGVEERRNALLPLAKRFALLPASVKEKYEHPESFYSFGWSHGKEKLQGGLPDVAKGSFYNNPTANKPFDDPATIAEYPTFAHPNIWPTDELPELEPAFMNLGGLIVDTGKLLAKHVDSYVRTRLEEKGHKNEVRLFDVIAQSRVTKARLLHYFSAANQGRAAAEVIKGDTRQQKRTRSPSFSRQRSSSDVRDASIENWCGWHNDHGSLTGLCPGMYIDAEGRSVREHLLAVAHDRPEFAESVREHLKHAGLYICSRKGDVVKVDLGDSLESSLLFQIGETAQIHSGGSLQATPHSVRGIKLDSTTALPAGVAPYLLGISRESFAVFMEPEWGEAMRMPSDVEASSVQSKAAVDALPSGCPPLLARIGTKDCPFTT